MALSMWGAVDIETGALILTFDPSGLQEFVELLLRHEANSIRLIPSPPRRATRPISTLRIEIAGDAVTASVDDGSARLSGSSAGFARLAREVGLFAKHNDLFEPGMHMHVDPGDVAAEGIVLSGDSSPLIVTGPVPDES